MYSAVHIYSNLPVAVKVRSCILVQHGTWYMVCTSRCYHGIYITMLQVIQRRKVKSWDVLHGHSVPREFRLLHQLQGEEIVGDHKTVSRIYSTQTCSNVVIYERHVYIF